MEILGIDVGGSGVKGAPVDCDNGELLAERFRLATPARSTPEAVAKTIRQIADHFAWHGPIGCGLPSVVKNGVVRTAANIDAGWIGTDAHAHRDHRFLAQLARLAQQSFATARANIPAGREEFPEPTSQLMEALPQFETPVAQMVRQYCR